MLDQDQVKPEGQSIEHEHSHSGVGKIADEFQISDRRIVGS
jgi:hypothetical protein